MAQNYCGTCGNAVKPDDLYCTKCGAHLSSENIGAKQPDPATPVQKQRSQSAPPISPEQQQINLFANADTYHAPSQHEGKVRNEVGVCILCQQEAVGKRYDYYYGHFLGSKEISHGGPGGINQFEHSYHVYGKSRGFICKACFRQRYWKEFFKWKNLKEIPVVIPLVAAAGLAYGTKFIVGILGIKIDDIAVAAAMLICLPIFIFLFKCWAVYIDFGNEMAFHATSGAHKTDPTMVFISPTTYKAITSNRGRTAKK